MKNTKQVILSILVIAIVIIGAASLISNKSGLPAQTGGPAAVGDATSAGMPTFDSKNKVDLPIAPYDADGVVYFFFKVANNTGDVVYLVSNVSDPGDVDAAKKLRITEDGKWAWTIPPNTFTSSGTYFWTTWTCFKNNMSACSAESSPEKFDITIVPPISLSDEVITGVVAPALDASSLIDLVMIDTKGECKRYDVGAGEWLPLSCPAEVAVTEAPLVKMYVVTGDSKILTYKEGQWVAADRELYDVLGVEAPVVAEEVAVTPEASREPLFLSGVQTFAKNVVRAVGNFFARDIPSFFKSIFGGEKELSRRCQELGQDLLVLRNALNNLDPSDSNYQADLNQIKAKISDKLLELQKNKCDCKKEIRGVQRALGSNDKDVIVTAIDKLLKCLGIEVEEKDLCLNIPGLQTTVPLNYVWDEDTLTCKRKLKPFDDVTLPSVGGVDLSIEKLENSPFSYASSSTNYGSGSYVINVINNGPDDASNITVVDDLPAGFTFDPSSSGGTDWSCFASGQQVVCTYTGPSIPAGGSFPPLIIGVTVVVSASQWTGSADMAENCATVGFPAPPPAYFTSDLDADNSRDCVDIIIQTIRP